MESIRYSDYIFTYPAIWTTSGIPDVAGLYAIQIADDGATPRPFRLIYVGQADNLNRRMSEHWRDDLPLWSDDGARSLYVSLLLAPSSTEERRCEAEAVIIRNYAPRFNGILGSR